MSYKRPNPKYYEYYGMHNTVSMTKRIIQVIIIRTR